MCSSLITIKLDFIHKIPNLGKKNLVIKKESIMRKPGFLL